MSIPPTALVIIDAPLVGEGPWPGVVIVAIVWIAVLRAARSRLAWVRSIRQVEQSGSVTVLRRGADHDRRQAQEALSHARELQVQQEQLVAEIERLRDRLADADRRLAAQQGELNRMLEVEQRADRQTEQLTTLYQSRLADQRYIGRLEGQLTASQADRADPAVIQLPEQSTPTVDRTHDSVIDPSAGPSPQVAQQPPVPWAGEERA